jgi:hypothetical protein
MATLKELAQTVQIEVAYGAPYNQDFPDSHAYTITLTYQGRSMQTPFYTGRGRPGAEHQLRAQARV